MGVLCLVLHVVYLEDPQCQGWDGNIFTVRMRILHVLMKSVQERHVYCKLHCGKLMCSRSFLDYSLPIKCSAYRQVPEIQLSKAIRSFVHRFIVSIYSPLSNNAIFRFFFSNLPSIISFSKPYARNT